MIKILLLHTPLKNEGLLSDKENRKLKNLRHKNYKLTTIKCIDLLLSRKDIYYNTNKYIKYEDYIINNYIFNDKVTDNLKQLSFIIFLYLITYLKYLHLTARLHTWYHKSFQPFI